MLQLILIILLAISGLPVIKAGIPDRFDLTPVVPKEPEFEGTSERGYGSAQTARPRTVKNGCLFASCPPSASTPTTTPMTSSTGPAATITSSTTCAATDTACNYCALAFSQLDLCQSMIDSLGVDETYIFDCLCYEVDSNDDIEWAPNFFDSAVASCPAYASTADSADVTLYQSFTGLCNTLGDYYAVSTTDTNSFVLAEATSAATSAAESGGGSSPTPGSTSSASAPTQTSGSRSQYQLTGLLAVVLTATLSLAVSSL